MRPGLPLDGGLTRCLGGPRPDRRSKGCIRRGAPRVTAPRAGIQPRRDEAPGPRLEHGRARSPTLGSVHEGGSRTIAGTVALELVPPDAAQGPARALKPKLDALDVHRLTRSRLDVESIVTQVTACSSAEDLDARTASLEAAGIELYRRVIDGLADAGYPIGLHLECPYAFNAYAFEVFHAMLDHWSPPTGHGGEEIDR